MKRKLEEKNNMHFNSNIINSLFIRDFTVTCPYNGKKRARHTNANLIRLDQNHTVTHFFFFIQVFRSATVCMFVCFNVCLFWQWKKICPHRLGSNRNSNQKPIEQMNEQTHQECFGRNELNEKDVNVEDERRKKHKRREQNVFH